MLCDYFDSRKNQYFQEAFDDIYNFLPIWSPSSQEIEEFNKIVDEELGIEDVEFNTIIKSLFTAAISIDAIRKISHNHGFKTSIDTTIAFNKLKKLYEKIENKNIINFIFFLIFEPMEYIKEIVKGLKDNNFRELKNTLKDFIQCGDFTIKQGKSPMVIDMFCNSDDIIHKLFTDEYYEIPFNKFIPTKDTIGKDYFENMIESVIKNKEESYKQSGGGNPGTNDEMLASLKVISQLKNHWHNIVASNLTAPVNKSIFNSYTNNINIDANKGLDIYLGNYSLIGGVNTGDNVNNSVYEAAKNSLVIYQDKFNALSEPNKKKLCTFLVKWRDNFNKICKNAANIITSNIQTINNSLGNGVKFSDIESSLTKKFSTTLNNNNIAKSIGQAYASIVTDFSRKQANNQLSSLQDKISWCCSFYAPIVDSISQKLSQDRNINVKYVQFANKERSMQILPFVNFQPMNNNMSGGSSQPEVKTVEKVVYRDRPIDRVIYRDSQVINSSPSSSRSVTGSYIENIINEQKQFNKIFEEAYRNLIKSFVSISTSKLTIQNSKMFDCVYALKSIGIDSPKTTVYLSGLYAAKNWNSQYIASCKRVIMKLQEVDSNMFSATISAIEKIVSICEASAKKAQEYITNYMTASKSTSEIITNINKVVKIPCRLSQEELNSYRENLQKLLSAFTSVSNESSAYSLKQQTDSYIKNVESRSQLIREYFRFKDEQAKLGASAMFNADRLQMITQLNSQMKECLLYLNNVVDVKLTQYRQEVSDKKSFDDKMIEKFEKAMIQFKDMSNNQELNKTLDKLKDAIYFKRGSQTGTEKEEKRMFNLLQLVQKFWKQSGYIDFVTQLYREFNIFQEGFNWSQFRDNISLLLALVNISVSTQYRIKSQFLKADGTPYDNLPAPLQSLYGVKPDGTNGAVSTPLDLGIFDIIDYTSIQQIATDIVTRFSTGPTNITTANSENAAVVIQAIQQAIQQSLVYSNNNGIFKAKTQLVPLLIGAGAPAARVDVFIELSFSEKHFNFALTPKDNNDNGGEFKLANMIFDAMLLNVVDIMNKYAEIKYTGHFNLPIQVSTLIRGGDSENNYNVSVSDGDKTIGGNVFDVLSVNDNNYDNIIDEAVPFYVSAFNIIIFYYMKYHNGEGPSELEKADLYFNVPKISPIYPITSKIEAYEIKSTSQLNYQLIKCGVGVFNTYWKRATGTTPAEKLSSSIDMILNEINACMVYTTKLQYDAMKLTGTLPNNFLQSLQSNISNLTDSLQKAISESMINISMNNEQQAMMYEEIMKRDYNIIKASKENEKLNTLLRILTQGDKANDSASEIYKFIDLALMPLLQTSVSYSNIFSLFNLCVSTDTEQIMENALDLSKIYIVLPADLEHNNKKMSIWECIQYVYKYYKSSDIKLQTNAAIIKQFLETSPVVEQWNIYVISNAVYDIVYNNKSYNIPDQMWFPIYPGTYPKTPTITSKSGAGVKVGDDIKLLLYQLYPFSAGNSLYDYFITALSEFANDIDHCLHLLLAYPNIHDKFIKSVSNSVHNFIDSSESVADRFNITPDIKDKMTKVKMSRDLGFIKPPPYKNAFFLPQFGGDKQIMPSISVYDSGEYINNSAVNELVFLAVDGYNQNIIMNTNKNMENTIVSYSWTDWVVQKLADCDTTFACLPYKLVQLLQSQSILSRKIQPQIFEQIGKEGKQPLPYDRNGYLENVVTQNIMGRSLSQTNQMKSQDNNAMSKQWIANLIGLIPFMINKMKTYAMNIKAGVRYGDISVKSELTALSACLITFYNDLISSCPKIGFMENTAGFENNLSYHAIGEIVPYLIKRNIENMSSAEYSKFEWANKYFFSSIQELIFPEYQNFDRFAKIKEYASNVFANAIFANEFDSVKCILAKNLWSSSIIVSGIKSANRTPESKMYEYIYKAINLTGELAPDIGERFVNNCIRVLRNDRYVSGNKEERTGDKWQTNEGLTGDKDKARMFNMIDNLKQIIDGIKATAYGNVNMTIQPPGAAPGAGAPARVNNPIPAYGYIITEQGFNAVLSSNIDKDTVNNIINYFQSLDDELNNKTLNTDLIHNAVLYTKIMGLGDGEYKRAIREIINKAVPAAAPGGAPPAPPAPMRFVYDSKLHSNIRAANMNATSYVDIDNCIMILLHFFLVLLPYSNKFANPAEVFTDYTAVGGLNGAGPLGQTQNQSLNTVNDMATLATVTNLQKAGLHLNIDNSVITMFDPSFVQNIRQLFANNDNATLPYKANLYAVLKSIINVNSREIIKDRAIKLFGLTSKNKDIINKLFKILKTDNHGNNDIIDTICDYLLLKPTALSNAAAAEAPTGLGNIYGINRAVPNLAPINFTTVYNPIAQKFRDTIIAIDKSIYSDRTGLISLLTTEQNVAIDTAANITASLDNIYKVIDSSISNGLNRGYKNASLAGGYERTDINKAISIMLSGLIDLTSVPMGVCDDILKELDYDDSLVLAGKLLNNIGKFKVFPCINDRPFPILNHTTKFNIYELLNNVSFTRNINDFSHDMYLFTPATDPYSQVTDTITYSNAKNYISFYTKYGNSSFFNQIKPLFALFDSFTYNAGTNHIELTQNNLNANINKIYGVNIDIKILAYYIKLLLGYDNTPQNDNVATQGNDAIAPSVLGNGPSVNRQHEMVYADNDNNTTGFTDLTRVVPKFVYRISDMAALLYANDAIKALIPSFSNIEQNKINTSNEFKNKLSTIIGYLSVLVDSGEIKGILNFIIKNYPQFLSDNNQYGSTITLLRSIVFAKYIQAYLYQIPDSFTNHLLNIDDIIACEGMTNILHSTLPVFGDKLSNNTTGYITPYNSNTNNPYKPAVNSSLEKYIMTTPKYQPVIEFSNMEYIIREVRSKYGVYSVLNPFKELISASAILIGDGLNYEDFASLKYLPRQGTNGKQLIGTCETNARGVPRAREGAINDIINPTAAIATQVKYTFAASQDYITIGAFDSGLLRHRNNDFEKRIGTFYHVFASEMMKQLMEAMGTNYKQLTAADYKYISVECDINSPNITNANVLTKMHLGVGDIPNLKVLYDSVNSPSIYAYKFCPEQTNNMFSDKLTTGSTLGHGITAFGTNINNAVLELKDNIWVNDSSPVQTTAKIISDIFNGVTDKLETTANTGFAYNVMSGGASAVDLSEGVDIGKQLLRSFIPHPEDIQGGISPAETYANIYKDVIIKDEKGEAKLNTMYKGNSIFSNVFKFSNAAQMTTDYMFALIINYYHKYTVSFNSIYNQVLFPSIIYNSSIYSTISKKYTDLFDKETAPGANNFTKFIKSFLLMIDKEPSNFFDTVANVDETATIEREQDMSYDKLSQFCKEYLDAIDARGPAPIVPADREKLGLKYIPSINDKFLRLLISKGFISFDDENNKFRKSSLLSSIKRVDIIETFMFVILLISKYMSYYNLQMETDIAYSGQIAPEPFGYKFDI